jgi:hypothetical protein
VLLRLLRRRLSCAVTSTFALQASGFRHVAEPKRHACSIALMISADMNAVRDENEGGQISALDGCVWTMGCGLPIQKSINSTCAKPTLHTRSCHLEVRFELASVV